MRSSPRSNICSPKAKRTGYLGGALSSLSRNGEQNAEAMRKEDSYK